MKRLWTVASPGGWALVAVIYAITMGVSAFRFWHWGPDTRYYLALTYRYSGFSEHEAGRRTYEFLSRFEWFKDYCYYACDPGSPDATYGHLFHGEIGEMVATRVVYPLVSVPFVWLLGPSGMLVAPFLAYTAAIVLVMVFVSRVLGKRWAPLAAVMFIVPTTVSVYALYAYTEALAFAFVTGILLLLPIARRASRRDLIGFAVLLTLLAFTRQFHLVVVGAVGLAWLGVWVERRTPRNEWLPLLGIGVAVTGFAAAVQAIVGPGPSVVRSDAVASVAVKLIRAELWNLGLDIPLAIVCGLALAGLVWRPRSDLTLPALGAVLATFLLNVLNTEPSFFRYYVTAYPFIAVLAVSTVSTALTASGRRDSGQSRVERDLRAG